MQQKFDFNNTSLVIARLEKEETVKAAIPVWKQFGLEKKVDYSIRGGHPHCQLPKEQYGIVEDFIDRFLLKKGMQ